jgi:hypothetical protein
MTHHWKAEVTVTGVPLVTEEEFGLMFSILSGLIQHESETGVLVLTWRFENNDPHVQYAIDEVSSKWRTALAHVESATDPVCTNFRVYQVDGL